MRNSGIGGQAVMEGVMMRNKDKYAVAVRKQNNDIVVETREHHSFAEKYKIAGIPIVRGVVAFVESMVMGINTLMISADYLEEENPSEEKEETAGSSDASSEAVTDVPVMSVRGDGGREKNNKNTKGTKGSSKNENKYEGNGKGKKDVEGLKNNNKVIDNKESKESNADAVKEDNKNKKMKDSFAVGLTVVVSIIIAIGVFMILPYFISRLLSGIIASDLLLALIEGLIRMVIFILYVVIISHMEDIKRVFMYHGAEHKSINCIENGLPLTVENARKQSREHKRCGTSFLLYVMIISIIFFAFIRVDSQILRVVLRLLMVPVIAGVAYEFIKLAGNSNSKIVALLSRPGFWLQGLTTREPDDSMLEVAICSVEAVFDWRSFLKEEKESQKAEKPKKEVKPKKEQPQKTEKLQKEGLKEEEKPKKEVMKKEEKPRKEESKKKEKKERILTDSFDASKPAGSIDVPSRAVSEEETESTTVYKAKVLKTGTRGHGKKKSHSFLEELNQTDFSREFSRPERRLNEEEFDLEEDDEILSKLDHFFEDKEKEI